MVAYSIQKPQNWQQFERAICVLVRCVLDDPNAHQNGRLGQPQHGVDIWGVRASNRKMVGVQCKHHLDRQVTENELRGELEKAKSFDPRIDEFVLATTAPRDEAIQTLARKLTEETLGSDHPIRVSVWGWQDIEEEALRHVEAQKAFDPTYSPYVEKLGQDLVREFNELGFLVRKIDERAPHAASEVLVQHQTAWKSVPPTESNLAAYIRSSPLVQRLDDQIAQSEGLAIKRDETVALPEEENAKFFDVCDIAELDRLLEENQEAIIWISSYTFRDRIPRGASILGLFNVLGAQLGENDLRKLNNLRQLTCFSEVGIHNLLNAYAEFSKNHKIKVRVPVPDFNLISIEHALSFAREQCRRSAFVNSLPAVGSNESELLAYFEGLKNKIRFFGSLRGHHERMALGQLPLSSPLSNPRFNAGQIIVDSQRLHTDSRGNLTATNVTYERLYVLRPDLVRAVEQLKASE